MNAPNNEEVDLITKEWMAGFPKIDAKDHNILELDQGDTLSCIKLEKILIICENINYKTSNDNIELNFRYLDKINVNKFNKNLRRIEKNMKKLEEIKRYMQNIQKRYSDYPIKVFFDKISIAYELMDFLNYESDSTEDIFQEALKNFIISLVTGIEVYLSDWCRFLIDKFKLNYRKIPKITPKFTIEEIEYIINNKLTMGSIFARYANFQNLGKINSFFSGLLGIDFMTNLKSVKTDLPNGKSCFNDEDYILLEELIEVRHEFVHDINFQKNFEFDDVLKYFNTVEKFGLSVNKLILMFVNNSDENFKRKD